MTVTALLFASYADVLGRNRVDLKLPDGATVADAVRELRALDLSHGLPPSILVAVNERYARPDQALRGGDEVAFIPPVAGG